MPDNFSGHRLSSRERIIFSTATVALTAILSTGMGLRAYRTVKEIDRVDDPIQISRAGLLNLTDPSRAFDQNPATSWTEPIWKFQPSVKINRSTVPDMQNPYILFEAGLSHRASQPPEKNPPDRLILKRPDSSSKSVAKVSRLRVYTFQKQLVDVDREYAFPDLPVYMAHSDFIWPVDKQTLSISLNNLIETPEKSNGFPHEIKKYWIRIEFIDFLNVSSGTDRSFDISEIILN